MSQVDSAENSRITILLVHGACHGSWCWEEVVPPLVARGYDVSTVDLPFTTLEDDAEVVRREIARLKAKGQSVLLAGHSYGGMVISAGGHESDRLVYLGAILPNPSEAVADSRDERITPELQVAMDVRTPELEDAVSVAGDGLSMTLDPKAAIPAFYARCSDEQARRAVERLRPTALACVVAPVDDPAWLKVPTSYVVCGDDKALSPAYQRDRAEVVGDSVEFDCDHSLFYSATEPLVNYLDACAARLRI